ncbi:hypothetical protein OSB04_017857 [Centaurea solstitialis]|uniref:F-box domain-containing protein n=1 Tax=Centaurea solstitialis TaxID=347529 RepID=A0AA38TLR9_9ASTR|nr:hypothetical protein OSB04_017857 [Centaurea solstitialis]
MKLYSMSKYKVIRPLQPLHKKMASSQQPTSMENLPNDILLNILIRLPAKQLGQMRCVSKPWEFLLSQPSFVKSHLHRSTNNLNDEIFLVLPDGDYEDVFSVTAHFSRSPHLKVANFVKLPGIPSSALDKVIFFGSVNGLICFGFHTYHHSDDFVIQIWNPSLSAVLTVPPCDCIHDLDFLHFRFGYDPKTDDYKLVKLMNCSQRSFGTPKDNVVSLNRYFITDAQDLVKVEVYSMRKGSWKLITNRLPSHVRVLSDAETICTDGHDGHLHWFGNDFGVGSQKTIVSFDFGVESFGEIRLPDSKTKYHPRRWLRLGVYNGKLCVTAMNVFKYEVWVMNEYGVTDSWVKMHVFFNYRGDMKPYGFTSNNKFLFRINTRVRLDFKDPTAGKVESFVIRDGGDPELGDENCSIY